MYDKIVNLVEEERRKHKENMLGLAKEYTDFLLNQTGIEKGDIVESDYSVKILVDSVQYKLSSYNPTDSYFILIGKKLKKDNTLRKDKTEDNISMSRILNIIKKNEDNK